MESQEVLKSLVKAHRVCWEVLPEQIPLVEAKPRQVGFNLLLYGTHELEDHPLPGCKRCQIIYQDLRKIARWIIPNEPRISRYEIEIFDRAIRYDHVRRNRPDVTLIIKILHRSDFDQPIDECEMQCLTEMKMKLAELGAQEGRWKAW